MHRTTFWAAWVVVLLSAGLVHGQTGGQTGGPRRGGVPKVRIVDASNIASDFLDDFAQAAQFYENQELIVRGRIGNISFYKDPQGNTIGKLFLLSMAPLPKEIPLQVNFVVRPGDGAQTAKPGDIVELAGVRYTAVPPPPVIHEITLFTADAFRTVPMDDATKAKRAQIATWLKANGSAVPIDPFVNEMADKAAAHIMPNQDFLMVFGSQLMKSTQPTEIGMINGKFFSRIMTQPQATEILLPVKGFIDRNMGNSLSVADTEVTFDPPVFTSGKAWDANTPLTGKVIARLKRPGTAPNVEYALQLTYVVGIERRSLLARDIPLGKMTDVSFSIVDPILATFKTKKGQGASIVVLDIIRIPRPTKPGQHVDSPQVVVSDPQVLVMEITAK